MVAGGGWGESRSPTTWAQGQRSRDTREGTGGRRSPSPSRLGDFYGGYAGVMDHDGHRGKWRTTPPAARRRRPISPLWIGESDGNELSVAHAARSLLPRVSSTIMPSSHREQSERCERRERRAAGSAISTAAVRTVARGVRQCGSGITHVQGGKARRPEEGARGQDGDGSRSSYRLRRHEAHHLLRPSAIGGAGIIAKQVAYASGRSGAGPPQRRAMHARPPSGT